MLRRVMEHLSQQERCRQLERLSLIDIDEEHVFRQAIDIRNQRGVRGSVPYQLNSVISTKTAAQPLVEWRNLLHNGGHMASTRFLHAASAGLGRNNKRCVTRQ